MAIDYEKYWNGPVGEYWAARQQEFDAVLSPIGEAAKLAAKLKGGDRVLDLGCGTGTTTFEIAADVAPGGEVLGLDISKPMLELARQRGIDCKFAHFIEADAATYRLKEAFFDVLYSRVGCMFFPDPVEAFSNLRRGLKSNARVSLACFREPHLTTYVTVPMQAALKFLPARPAPGPDDPHMFSFAKPERVKAILTAAGYHDVNLCAHDIEVDLAAGQGLERAMQTAIIGGVGALLLDQDDITRTKVMDEVRNVLHQYQREDRVPMNAAIWVVTARA